MRKIIVAILAVATAAAVSVVPAQAVDTEYTTNLKGAHLRALKLDTAQARLYPAWAADERPAGSASTDVNEIFFPADYSRNGAVAQYIIGYSKQLPVIEVTFKVTNEGDVPLEGVQAWLAETGGLSMVRSSARLTVNQEGVYTLRTWEQDFNVGLFVGSYKDDGVMPDGVSFSVDILSVNKV